MKMTNLMILRETVNYKQFIICFRITYNFIASDIVLLHILIYFTISFYNYNWVLSLLSLYLYNTNVNNICPVSAQNLYV